jgi:hypothetical protein
MFQQGKDWTVRFEPHFCLHNHYCRVAADHLRGMHSSLPRRDPLQVRAQCEPVSDVPVMLSSCSLAAPCMHCSTPLRCSCYDILTDSGIHFAAYASSESCDSSSLLCKAAPCIRRSEACSEGCGVGGLLGFSTLRQSRPPPSKQHHHHNTLPLQRR